MEFCYNSGMEKVIMIAGGSDGLGKEIARLLVKGNTVVILSPTQEKVEKAADELDCDWAVADVSEWEMNCRVVEEVMEKYQRIDVLINCAGIWLEGELEDNDPAKIKRVLEINTLGTILLTKAVLPQMKKQKAGLIINIISQAGLYQRPGKPVYTASKWALTGFTKSLQQELKGSGVRMSGVYPGKMNTGMFAKAGVAKEMDNAVSPVEVAKAVEFLVNTTDDVLIPEIGIKNVEE